MTDKHEPRRRPNPIAYVWALLLDIAFILLFAYVGRASHDESTGLQGVLTTVWPFLVGMLVGSLLVYLLRWRPTRPAPAGILVWFLTLVLGMGLRAMTNEGTATAFVLVATVFLLIFLVGWRLLPTLVRLLSTRGGSESTDTEKERRRRAATGERDHAREPFDDKAAKPRRRYQDADEIDG